MMAAVTQATAQSNSRVNERCYRTVGLHRITVYNHVCFFFLFLPSALLLDGISKCLRSFMSFLRNILNDDVYGISASLFSSSEQSSYNAMFSLLHFVFWSNYIFFLLFFFIYTCTDVLFVRMSNANMLISAGGKYRPTHVIDLC